MVTLIQYIINTVIYYFQCTCDHLPNKINVIDFSQWKNQNYINIYVIIIYEYHLNSNSFVGFSNAFIRYILLDHHKHEEFIPKIFLFFIVIPIWKNKNNNCTNLSSKRKNHCRYSIHLNGCFGDFWDQSRQFLKQIYCQPHNC